LNRAVDKILQWNFSLHELLLQHIDDSLQLEIVRTGDGDLLIFLIQLNLGLGILEIESRQDFF
jgi:hypothetical protein